MLSALLLILSFPPFPFAFLSYIAFIPLLMVIDQTPERVFEDRFWGFFKGVFVVLWRFLTLQFIWRRNAPRPIWRYERKIISHSAQVFRYGYTAFIIWNLGCCYWLMLTALGVPDDPFAALISGLMANVVNPFLMAIPLWCYTRVKKISPYRISALAFILFWITFEWLHFNWDLSWSWLTLGHCMTYYPINLQYLEYTGILGTSMQILAVNLLLYQWLYLRHDKQEGQKLMVGLALGVLAIPLLLYPILTNSNRSVFQATGSTNVRIIQPNIDPYGKYEQFTRLQQVKLFSDLIKREGLDSVDVVVLPETAIPKGIWTHEMQTDPLLKPLWEIVRSDSVTILAGINEIRMYNPHEDEIPASAKQHGQLFYDVCNSSMMLRVDTFPQSFQKAKLVPVVERMPFLDQLSFLRDWNIRLGGVFGSYGLPDSSRNLVTQEQVQIASLICYESEYGDYVREFTGKGADMLTIITNDGWWQRSSGHIQHAHFSTLRAIENRRAIARSANTGISLFCDNKGYIQQPTRYWTIDVIDQEVKLYDNLTFYVRHGDYLGWLSAIGTLLVMGWVIFRLYTANLPKLHTFGV